MKELSELIISILKTNNKYTNQEINPKTNLRLDLGMDSFDLAQLTVEIEDHFDIDIFENSNPIIVEDILNLL